MKFIVLLFAFLSVGAFATEKPIVRIAELATVNANGPLKMIDLVARDSELSPQEANLLSSLDEIVLPETLQAGRTLTIANQVIVRTLRENLSFRTLQEFQFKIPQIVRVRAVRNHISQQRIALRIDSLVRAFCADCLIRISDLQIPNYSGSAEILEHHLRGSGPQGSGAFTIPLVLQTSSGTQNVQVSGELLMQRSLFVAKRNLRFNEILQESDFEARLTRVQFSKEASLQSSDIKGLKVARPLAAGQVISLSDLAPVPLIRRGQAITAEVGGEGLTVTVAAEASQDGLSGEKIRIQLKDSKKILTGTVIDESRVRVE